MTVQGERTRAELWNLLAERPGQNKRQLLAGLRLRGLSVESAREVNRTLYRSSNLFVHDGATPPRWHLTSGSRSAGLSISTTVGPALPRCYRGREPRAWQLEALIEWRARGRCGVVEAVTGTGKTAVGVLAAAAALDAGEKVLVLVPGRELLDQWYEVLRRDLRNTRVGRVGDGHRDSFDHYPILVAVVHSAARRQMLTWGTPGLLVADEVHRYGAPSFALALEPEFDARLGLTATYERSDDGLAEHLDPYFGGMVAGCGYQRGLEDGILAPFRVAFLGVDFTSDERRRHDEYDERAKVLRRRLIEVHGCPEEPFGEFMAHVNRLREGSHGDHWAVRDARGYLNAFSKRRQLLADCRPKQEALSSLTSVLAAAGRGLVFSETKASAEQAAAVLIGSGIRARPFTSGLRRADRKDRLAAFKDGNVRVLTAPRVLDEGVDVPQAEVGVILAGSRSRRQMIQRMGRVIRPKADRRPAAFIVMYVTGTAEDPAQGAHEAFLGDLTHVAEKIDHFDPGTAGSELLGWYYEGRTEVR
ncbi:DEAD/DEAH box helicase family protein [Micromonospora zhanjiangensis]|uniref:DEAD/DEAH box helicase family protein n=1 Tax=Micromonospora zhanjiangensis TaxID=1522057 RepID=A0ABV8KN72_9ACTN